MPLFLSAIITSKLYLQKLLSKMLGHFCFFVMKQKKKKEEKMHCIFSTFPSFSSSHLVILTPPHKCLEN